MVTAIPEDKVRVINEIKLVRAHDALPAMIRGVINQDVVDERFEDAWRHSQPYLPAAKKHFQLMEHEHGDERVFASLVGPFIGYYIRVPHARDDLEARVMLSTCRHTKYIWCSIYTFWEVLEAIDKYGRGDRGIIRVSELDYDSHELRVARRMG